jgi:hypothetical protein
MQYENRWRFLKFLIFGDFDDGMDDKNVLSLKQKLNDIISNKRK